MLMLKVHFYCSICVGYMCMGCTAACIGMYKGLGLGPLGHSPKGYGVHQELQLPDCIRHGSPTP